MRDRLVKVQEDYDKFASCMNNQVGGNSLVTKFRRKKTRLELSKKGKVEEKKEVIDEQDCMENYEGKNIEEILTEMGV